MVALKIFKKKIENNPIILLLYRAKADLDIGKATISWFTAMLPEAMAFLFILDRFGLKLSNTMAVIVGIGFIMLLVILGWFWKQSGFYDTDRRAVTIKDPIMNEVYTAAKKINGEVKCQKKI